MCMIPKTTLNALREKYPVGARVKLLRMNDRNAPPINTLGTVQGVDDIGTIHVDWDTGSSLGVAYGEDEVALVPSISFDPSDLMGMRKIMTQYGDSEAPFSGINEDGEPVLIGVSKEKICVTTFQKNGWIRENHYWEDGTCEELFSGNHK